MGETQMQNFNKNSIIPTSQDSEVDKLIGREGCNLKTITERIDTFIHADTKPNPAQIKICTDKKKEVIHLKIKLTSTKQQ